MLEKIEEYINSIDLKNISFEELEHLLSIYVILDNKRLDDIERKEILNKIKG